MECRPVQEGKAPVHVLSSATLRLLAWGLSVIAMAAASMAFDAFAFPDMLAASALLALACATPFQRDVAVDMAMRQIARQQAPERSWQQQRQ